MQTGTRGTQPVSPRNITGQIFAQKQREKAAKDATADIDVAAVKRQSFAEGYEAGYERGSQSFIDALYDMYKAEGIKAVQEFLNELDAEEDVR
jgi:flagellar biosynthesis/type III secretory pathway protein FliH